MFSFSRLSFILNFQLIFCLVYCSNSYLNKKCRMKSSRTCAQKKNENWNSSSLFIFKFFFFVYLFILAAIAAFLTQSKRFQSVKRKQNIYSKCIFQYNYLFVFFWVLSIPCSSCGQKKKKKQQKCSTNSSSVRPSSHIEDRLKERERTRSRFLDKQHTIYILNSLTHTHSETQTTNYMCIFVVACLLFLENGGTKHKVRD